MRIRLLAVAVLTSVSMLTVAAPAHAHDQLTASSPEHGQMLDTPPSAVSVTFSEDVLDIGTAIEVIDSNGTNWVSGPIEVANRTVTAPLTPNMPEGVYSMNWRVVSADGHPVSSTIVFGVGASEVVRDQVAVAAAAVGEPIDDDAPDATALAEPTGSAGPNQQPLVLGGIVLLALTALIIGVIAVRRGRAAGKANTDGVEQ